MTEARNGDSPHATPTHIQEPGYQRAVYRTRLSDSLSRCSNECCECYRGVFVWSRTRKEKPRDRPLRWFLVSGAIGIVVAFVLADLMIHDLVSTTVGLSAMANLDSRHQAEE